jgi:predicted SprT family Zn-dependent metalloprotease
LRTPNWLQRMKRPTSPGSEIPPGLEPVVAYCADLWGVPALLERVRIVPAPRMTVTLAHAYPATNTIRISSRVLESGSDELIREVLCHELAHLACRMRHGRRVTPHGREWKELMRQTGYEPRARFKHDEALPLVVPARRPLAFEHRCPICGWTQLARTTNRRWRCATCVRAGRDGKLIVVRVNPPKPNQRRRTAHD